MGEQQLNDQTLNIIMGKLKREEIMILEYLKKRKVINQQLALDKEKILLDLKKNSQEITSYKIAFFFGRLEVTNLILAVSSGRYKKFYITKDGLRLLELYMQELINITKKLK